MLHFSFKQLSEVPTEANEKKRWVVEASDLGIKVGFTPRQLATVIDGKVTVFNHLKVDEYESHIYVNTELAPPMNNYFLTNVIVVLND